eukprot:m.211547 g.211547  ORF g.211547 m.211547 type:complete len:77 (-) comp15062_c0_seq2:115-345(-)
MPNQPIVSHTHTHKLYQNNYVDTHGQLSLTLTVLEARRVKATTFVQLRLTKHTDMYTFICRLPSLTALKYLKVTTA